MTASAESASPRPGDIVVYKQHASGSFYTLSRFRLASQLTYHAYEEAIQHATRFAGKDCIDAWYTEDGETYQNIARHRPRET